MCRVRGSTGGDFKGRCQGRAPEEAALDLSQLWEGQGTAKRAESARLCGGEYLAY